MARRALRIAFSSPASNARHHSSNSLAISRARPASPSFGAREGTTVTATATPVHRGRRTQVWQTRIESEEGKLVAVVTQTQMVL
jgi:uncharacterized protein (TIGR00369 family)